MPDHVAQDEGGPFEPGDAPQGAEVGAHAEVAVALVPARDRVTRDRIHFHVQSEQVVAAFDSVLGDVLVDEVLGMNALAHQPSLHVRERDDDGVDRPGIDVRSELVQRQHL